MIHPVLKSPSPNTPEYFMSYSYYLCEFQQIPFSLLHLHLQTSPPHEGNRLRLLHLTAPYRPQSLRLPAFFCLLLFFSQTFQSPLASLLPLISLPITPLIHFLLTQLHVVGSVFTHLFSYHGCHEEAAQSIAIRPTGCWPTLSH